MMFINDIETRHIAKHGSVSLRMYYLKHLMNYFYGASIGDRTGAIPVCDKTPL